VSHRRQGTLDADLLMPKRLAYERNWEKNG
jgi:hypothetical protein